MFERYILIHSIASRDIQDIYIHIYDIYPRTHDLVLNMLYRKVFQHTMKQYSDTQTEDRVFIQFSFTAHSEQRTLTEVSGHSSSSRLMLKWINANTSKARNVVATIGNQKDLVEMNLARLACKSLSNNRAALNQHNLHLTPQILKR